MADKPTTEESQEPASDAVVSEVTKQKPPLWFRIFGFKRRQGKRIGYGFTKRGWCQFIMFAMLIGMVGFIEYSMTPDFCRSCHIMEPYYQAWHESTHRDVGCPDCHFEPGLLNTLKGKFEASSQAVKYITSTYGSKPHAEIRDASCLRSGCHEKRILEGVVDWEVPRQRGGEIKIRFDHTPHLRPESEGGLRRGKKLRCVSCHSQIVQGKHLTVTLDTCFLCHFKGVKHGRGDQTVGGCKGCHGAPKKKITLSTGEFMHKEYIDRGVACESCHSDSVRGDGAVPRQVCWTCHNKSAQVARYDEPSFVHQNHVTKHKVECSSCHVQIEHKLTTGPAYVPFKSGARHDVLQKGTCGQCHEETHGGPSELYRGRGGRGVPDMPSPMYRTQVDCIGCHKARSRDKAKASVMGQTYLAVQDSCNYCHAKKYEGRLDEWKKTIAELLLNAEAAYVKTKADLAKKTLSGMNTLAIRNLLDDANHNIRLVKLGHGVHNLNYSTALLNYALEQCKKAQGIMAPEGPPPTTTKPSSTTSTKGHSP
jgi:nitrate/TMAO reductase-like tetraheme cytochrome c subunit